MNEQSFKFSLEEVHDSHPKQHAKSPKPLLLEEGVFTPIAHVITQCVDHNGAKILRIKHGLPAQLAAKVLQDQDWVIGQLEEADRHQVVTDDDLGLALGIGLIGQFLLDDWYPH